MGPCSVGLVRSACPLTMPPHWGGVRAARPPLTLPCAHSEEDSLTETSHTVVVSEAVVTEALKDHGGHYIMSSSLPGSQLHHIEVSGTRVPQQPCPRRLARGSVTLSSSLPAARRGHCLGLAGGRPRGPALQHQVASSAVCGQATPEGLRPRWAGGCVTQGPVARFAGCGQEAVLQDCCSQEAVMQDFHRQEVLVQDLHGHVHGAGRDGESQEGPCGA